MEYTIIDKKETTFKGEKAIEITFSAKEKVDSPLVKMRAILMTKDGNSYAIIYGALPSDFDLADQKYFEPMLQSFTTRRATPFDIIRKICVCC